MGDRLTDEDTAEIKRYQEWFTRVQTDEWSRPSWFNETVALRPAGRPRRYRGRHRKGWRRVWAERFNAALDWLYRAMVGV